MTIRAVGALDAPLLATLHGACFPDEPWNTAAMRDVLAMPGAFGFLAVGTDPTMPAGFLLALDLGDECELLSLGVAAAERRRGLARALLDRLLETAGARAILLEVAEDNAAAFALYAGFAFEPVGRRPDYYRRRDGVAVAAQTLRRPGRL